MSEPSQSHVPAAVVDAMRSAQRVVIATHSPMDGDGLGSGLALQRALHARGANAVFVTEAPVPRSLRFLPGSEDIVLLTDDMPVPDADWLFGLDAGEESRLGRAFAERGEHVRVLNIDHHVSNPRYGDVVWVDAEAAAVGEQMYAMLRAADMELDVVAAQALLVSLVTDTGRFCYSSTTARTLETAAALVRAGARPDNIQRRLYSSEPIAVHRLRALAVDSLRFFADGKLCILTVEAGFGSQLGVDSDDVKDLIDVATSIEGVVVAAMVRGLAEGGTKVSLRSKDDRADVSAFSRLHGGGGHVRASGFSSDQSPAATEDAIRPGLEKLAVVASG